MTSITMFRIVERKIAEEYASDDMLELLQKLGALPPLPPATSSTGDRVKPQPLVLMPGEERTIAGRDSTLTVKVFGKDTRFAWSPSCLDVPADFVSGASAALPRQGRRVILYSERADPVRASYLVIGSPSGIGDYLVEIYELLTQPGPVNAAKMAEIFENHVLFITVPPSVMTVRVLYHKVDPFAHARPDELETQRSCHVSPSQ